MNSNKKNLKSIYDTSKLPTNKFIGLLDNYNPKKEEFNVLFSRLSKENWSHMVTVTFSRPVTDKISVEKFCFEYKKRLFKYLYGVSKKYKEIKICSFIESHKEPFNNKSKYHIHILVTLPDGMRNICSRYEFMYDNRSLYFQKILTNVLIQLRDTGNICRRCPIGEEYDIREVDNSMRVTDYCLKEFCSGRPEIAWEGSNISWTS